MAGHTLRLLDSIEHACEQYLAGGTAIEDLQAAVEPVVAALEADDEHLESALRRFVAQLEYIRFMFDDSEQLGEVEREISLLRSGLSSYSDRSAAHVPAE
jgi:hypothetical protein